MSVKYYIFGINYLSELVLDLTRWHDLPTCDILGFVVDDQYYTNNTFCGLPVYRYSKILRHAFSVSILLAVGYTKMNRHRYDIYMRLKNDGWKIGSYIDPEARIRTRDMGEGNIVLDGVAIGVGCTLGICNILYQNVVISHHTKVGDFNFFAPSSSVAGAVHIGNRCFFGNNSCTKGGIRIADSTLVGAGCYINQDVDMPGVAFAPARCVTLPHASENLL